MNSEHPIQNEQVSDDTQNTRMVCVTEDRAHWRKKFANRHPMLVLVRNGTVWVRRNGATYAARVGETVLLTPGKFELEATPSDRHGMICFEYAVFPVSLLGRIGCATPAIEELALQIGDNESGFHLQQNLLWKIDLMRREWVKSGAGLESILIFIVNQMPPSLFPFLRSVYFKTRWAMQILLERHILHREAVAHLCNHYIDGRLAFFRDCKTLTGFSPRKWLEMRRMELARIWIDGGSKSVADVATVFGYGNPRKFQRDYKKQHGSQPGSDESLQTFECWNKLRGGGSLLRPFWWPAPLPVREVERPDLTGDTFSKSASTAPGRDEADASWIPPSFNFGRAPLPEELDKKISKTFWDMNAVAVSEFISFPDALPELLKAA